ncbi:hypothetical protein SB861_16450 [Paraburkholderia sp. SIMBA_049]
MLHQILEANGGLPDDCIVSYQNVGKEREETIDRPPRSRSTKHEAAFYPKQIPLDLQQTEGDEALVDHMCGD